MKFSVCIEISGVLCGRCDNVSALTDGRIGERYLPAVITRITATYGQRQSIIEIIKVLLFPKRTLHESYRLCIQWKDQKGDCRFTYIHIASRIMADHMLNAVKRSLQAENRVELAQKLPKANERGAIVKAEQYKRHTEVSPFITCGHCAVEFRKTDLPPDGKCPVCGQAFKG